MNPTRFAYDDFFAPVHIEVPSARVCPESSWCVCRCGIAEASEQVKFKKVCETPDGIDPNNFKLSFVISSPLLRKDKYKDTVAIGTKSRRPTQKNGMLCESFPVGNCAKTFPELF